ncbi:MAG: hypothetical protein E6G80_02525 [Alphaproteobacteria bacterium]|nr:MAG: hypothetical protein E6G80_02525 [Alphaproteobacteria bacterium]TMJ85735.1 MAG: hypothetical protein E6G78_13925 [Alphaproteobacteria bacterium]TMJ99967.1 MAG: hypothetical protein E6G77_11695 [Alphaproteobacteria bacterium]TMK02582.1 MAG: hypothetical protein E6G74_06620 [Alphaproteobacteria bacterium]
MNALTTRQSIVVAKRLSRRMMDPRVKPAGDEAAHVILSPVIAGLDPAIHPSSQQTFYEEDGCTDQSPRMTGGGT